MTTPAATMLPAIIAKSNIMSRFSSRKRRLRPIALRLHSMDTMFGREPST